MVFLWGIYHNQMETQTETQTETKPLKIGFENLGTINKNAVEFENEKGNLSLYFSYKTPVGFRLNGRVVCRVNDWKQTTGKLLNTIEADKSRRIDGATFEALLNDTLGAFFK